MISLFLFYFYQKYICHTFDKMCKEVSSKSNIFGSTFSKGGYGQTKTNIISKNGVQQSSYLPTTIYFQVLQM